MPRPYVAPAPSPSTGRALKVAVGAIALVVVVLGALLVLPSIVRSRVIAMAREAGLDVTIEGVGIGLGTITLRDVHVGVPSAPGIRATIAEVHVTGWTGREARVLGLDLRLDGPRAELESRITALVSENRARFAGTREAPRHLSVVGARMTWQNGTTDRLDAGEIGLELDSRGAGTEDVHGSVGRFELRSGKATFGPWASAFERSPAAARLRLMFDPPLPDGPSALVVWTPNDGNELTEVTVKVPRSPFKNLGIAPADLGLPADGSTDIALSLTGALSAATRSSTFKTEATLYGIRPKGFSTRLDVRLEGSASSTGGKPFELEKTTVTFGPFVAGVSGTVTPHERGFRLDALFKTLPMPCERLARAEAKNMGPLAETLQALGQSTGALRVTGAVNASGVVKYDTAQPEGPSVAWLAKETCGVSIFGL